MGKSGKKFFYVFVIVASLKLMATLSAEGIRDTNINGEENVSQDNFCPPHSVVGPLSEFSLYDPVDCMLRDLETAHQIDAEQKDELPYFYNFSTVCGYFTMPSGRMPPMGTYSFGAFRPPPYNIYGVSLQPFDRIEVSLNYRVLKGITEANFGTKGFGDDADRVANIKLNILSPRDGISWIPSISIGADDFIGTSRFNSQYGVMTKQWKSANLETSLGWSRGRMKGWFGAAAWSPWRKYKNEYLQSLSFIAEYDNIDYKNHRYEHPEGREVKCRINGGIAYTVWDMLQVSISSLRGTKIAGGASFRYPLGTSEGLFTKIHDPLPYTSPIDTESLGVTRPENEFALELAYALNDQGLDLCCIYLDPQCDGDRLWIKVINNRYREEKVVRERLQDTLAALAPSNIVSITVVTEADAVPVQSYTFRTEDLRRFRLGLIGAREMAVLSPMREALRHPSGSTLIYKKNLHVWLFTFRPRLLTFFGSTTGKFKYNIGLLASPEGYFFNKYYYKFQFGYSIHSTMWNIGGVDVLNPSQLPNVRTDTIKYYQNNSVSLEKAFIQRSFALGKGCFYRLATGYFEIAYGGVATEFLYWPVHSNWAVGLEAASVLKRRYRGIAFTHKIRKYKGEIPHYIDFYGLQYFGDIYYYFRPLQLEFKVMGGQFLARDKGARFEVTRQFPSGLRLTVWYTATNGHDKVNGHTYFDKGVAFALPLDFFLSKSSRTYVGYGISAWLRDVGAVAETGKQLYNTLREERINY